MKKTSITETTSVTVFIVVMIFWEIIEKVEKKGKRI